MSKIYPPNFTQTPNALFDMMPTMKEAELRCVLAIVRETFGWHRQSKKMSITALQEATGLSRQGVINGLEKAQERGIVGREKDGDSFRYWLDVHEVYREGVHEVYTNEQLVNLVDHPSQPSIPPLDNVVDQLPPTLKKDKENNNKEKSVGEQPTGQSIKPAPALLNSQQQLPPATATAQQPATPKVTVRAAQPLTPSSAAPLPQWQPMTDMPLTQRDIVAEKLNGSADLSPRRDRPTFKSPHVKAALNAAGYVAAGQGSNPVEIYYERFSAYQPDERLSAPQEYDLMTLAGNAGVRPAIEAYGQTGYRAKNVKLIIEWTFDPSKYAQRGSSNGNTSVSSKQKQNVQIEQSAPVRPMGSIFRDPEPGEYN